MTGPRLECAQLAAGYGSVRIVQPIDLVLEAGTIVAILGPNGAGKTTLLTTIAGFLPSHHGEVSVDGTPLSNGSPREASKRGVVLVPDDRELFAGLTTEENIRLGAAKGVSSRSVLDMFPTLERRWNVAAGALSGGEQQMVALARALVQQPKVLLIDEMSMGLAPVIVEHLLPIVRAVADDTGAAIVLVEQHVGLALESADRALVLVHGEVALDAPALELAGDLKKVEDAYLGASAPG